MELEAEERLPPLQKSCHSIHHPHIAPDDEVHEESFVSGSEISRELNKLPGYTDVSIEFSKENLKRRIPHFTLINLIAFEYPELVTETNEVTEESLFELLKIGAQKNHLETLSDHLIDELAHALEIPTVDMPIRKHKEKSTDSSEEDKKEADESSIHSDMDHSAYRDVTQIKIMPPDETEEEKFQSSAKKSKTKTEQELQNFHRHKALMRSMVVSRVDNKYPEHKEGCWPRTSTPKLRYTRIVLVIIISSVIVLALFAFLMSFAPIFDLAGPGILFSRGSAVCILLLTMLAVFLVTYDVTTCCRNKLKTRCNTLFDFQVLFHRCCGFLITFYSFTHILGHLFGSFWGLSREKDLDEINKALTFKTFKEHKSYPELLFTTIPGVTGILLTLVISAMCITSLSSMRRKHFQLFAITHVICFPTFIILIVIHGSDTWLNYGFPLGSVTVLISLLVYFILWVRKLMLQCKGSFIVDHVDVSETNSFMYLHLKKPKYYSHMEGQYAFFHCPEISKWEWHPFSICSSGLSPYVSFFIKNNGDYSRRLIKRIKQGVESSIQATEVELKERDGSNSSKRDKAAGNKVMDLETAMGDANTKNGYKYPKIYLSYPISSPAALAGWREHVVYIGTGAGLATFLCFIDRQYIKCTKGIKCRALPEFKKTDLIFISRELEHMSWLAKYIEGLLTLPDMTKKMRFHFYITIKDDTSCLASFLFWRALTLYNRKNEKRCGTPKSLFVNIGRPDFDKLFDKICMNNDVKTHHIYACGPKVMTNAVEDICVKKSDGKKKKLVFNYEIF